MRVAITVLGRNPRKHAVLGREIYEVAAFGGCSEYISNDEIAGWPGCFAGCIERGEKLRLVRAILIAYGTVGCKAPAGWLLPKVEGRWRAVNDAVIWSIDGNQCSDLTVCIILQHPFASYRDA